MPRIEQYVDSQVAVVTLNDGEHGNLLGPEMLEELSDAFERSWKDPEVRAILLRSNGPDFCRGMDLARLDGSAVPGGSDQAQQSVARYAGLLDSIFTTGIPVVCLVQGEVKAGGVGLACVCDIVLATEGSGFELGEVLFGLIPANVLPYLLAVRVPPQKARYLVVSSQRITAAEALRLNLVDEIVTSSGAEKRVREILKRLLRSSPQALSDAKSFTFELIGKSPAEAAALGRRKLVDMLGDPATLAGVKAFQDGDVPPWFSRFAPQRPLVVEEKK